jgi:hypothetical protein
MKQKYSQCFIEGNDEKSNTEGREIRLNKDQAGK